MSSSGGLVLAASSGSGCIKMDSAMGLFGWRAEGSDLVDQFVFLTSFREVEVVYKTVYTDATFGPVRKIRLRPNQ